MENLPKYKNKMKHIIRQKLYLTFNFIGNGKPTKIQKGNERYHRTKIIFNIIFYRKWKTYQNTKRK